MHKFLKGILLEIYKYGSNSASNQQNTYIHTETLLPTYCLPKEPAPKCRMHTDRRLPSTPRSPHDPVPRKL